MGRRLLLLLLTGRLVAGRLAANQDHRAAGGRRTGPAWSAGRGTAGRQVHRLRGRWGHRAGEAGGGGQRLLLAGARWLSVGVGLVGGGLVSGICRRRRRQGSHGGCHVSRSRLVLVVLLLLLLLQLRELALVLLLLLLLLFLVLLLQLSQQVGTRLVGREGERWRRVGCVQRLVGARLADLARVVRLRPQRHHGRHLLGRRKVGRRHRLLLLLLVHDGVCVIDRRRPRVSLGLVRMRVASDARARPVTHCKRPHRLVLLLLGVLLLLLRVVVVLRRLLRVLLAGGRRGRHRKQLVLVRDGGGGVGECVVCVIGQR